MAINRKLKTGDVIEKEGKLYEIEIVPHVCGISILYSTKVIDIEAGEVVYDIEITDDCNLIDEDNPKYIDVFRELRADKRKRREDYEENRALERRIAERENRESEERWKDRAWPGYYSRLEL